MIKAKQIVLIGLLVAFSGLGFVTFVHAATVAVIKTKDIEAYNQALDGFKEALTGKDVNYWMSGSDAVDGKRLSFSATDTIKAKSPELIFTLGSTATEATQKEFRDIPIVFSMVLDPVSSGLIKSIHSSGNNLCGVSLDIPFKTQFQELVAVVPRVRKIGVIYNAQENKEVVNEASLIARAMGLELISAEVLSEKDVPDALDGLMRRVDVLWSVSDSVVTSQSLQYILLTTLRNKIPFMGISPGYVKAGALLALSCDYKDIGRQGGELAGRVLAGEQPATIPIVAPRRVFLSINLTVAEQIGVVVSSDVISRAKDVFR